MPKSRKFQAISEQLERRVLMAYTQAGPIYPAAIWTPAGSGNYGAGSSNPLWIVIHTTESTAASAINEFQTPGTDVSVNYLVDRQGNVYQFVNDNNIAYDVGNYNYNIDSIGIENERYTSGGVNYNVTSAEYRADAQLVVWIGHQYNLPLAHFAGNQTYTTNDTNVDNFAPQNPTSRVDNLGITEDASIIGHYQVPDPNDPNLGGGASNHYDPVNWNWYTPGQKVSETSPTFMDLVEEYNYPNTPTNVAPASNSAVTTFTPTLSASAFFDLDPLATDKAAEWQILNNSGTVIYDSGTDTHNLTSFTVPTGVLSAGQTYSWQVRYEGNVGVWSPYSAATKFVSPGGPGTPLNSSPANNATITNPVTLTASAFTDLLGGTHTASQWLVTDSVGATVFDSGADTTDLTSITIPSADLAASATYSWQVRYEDSLGTWSGYSSPTSFTMAGPPNVLSLSGSSNYYLQDSSDRQYLNVWNSTTNAGVPNESILLATISTVIINGATTGSSISIDFSNGSPAPQNRITIIDAGSSANNFLTILGSANGNDSLSISTGQIYLNSALTTYSKIGSITFTPGAGTDSLSLSSGVLNLGGPGIFSTLSISTGAILNLGSAAITIPYTNSPLASIQSMITYGQIASPLVASDAASSSAVGYFDTGNQISIRATWKGDANLDGIINADDLSLIMLGQAQHKTTWQAGNFNYDTQVDADDYVEFAYALAYSAGRSYSSVFAAGAALQSEQDVNQILSPTDQNVLS